MKKETIKIYSMEEKTRKEKGEEGGEEEGKGREKEGGEERQRQGKARWTEVER